MVTTQVTLVLILVLLLAVGHIHLTTEDRLEGLQSLFLPASVHLITVIEEFLDAKHVAMIGDSHAFHIVGNGFVYEFRDARLSVEYAVIGVNV